MKKVFVEVFEVFPNGLTANNYEKSFKSFSELESFINEINEESSAEKWHGLKSYYEFNVLEVID